MNVTPFFECLTCFKQHKPKIFVELENMLVFLFIHLLLEIKKTLKEFTFQELNTI